MEVKILKENNKVGLITRFKDKSNYYYLMLNSKNDKLEFYKIIKGKKKLLKRINSSLKIGQLYQVEMKIIDNLITVYKDGKQTFKVTDNTLSTGKIGISSSYSKANIDNVVIQLQ